MLSLFTIKPTEKNMQLARAAQIYYHQGVYSDDKPEVKAEKKPVVEPKAEQKKPVEQKPEQKADQKKPVEQKTEQKTEQKKPDKPVEQKAEQKKPDKPVEQKAEQKKPAEAVEKKSVEQAEQKKPVDQKKPVEAVEKKPEQKKPVTEQKKPEQKKPVTEQKKPVEQAEQKKPVDQKKPVEAVEKKPDIEILDSEGNVVAMLPGVPEEAPSAARTAAFDINHFVKPPKQQQASTKNLGQVKNIDEVYSFIRTNAVLRPFDPMPGYSINEKVAVLKTYANFNGTHPGLDELQINTLIMTFNSPDLSRKLLNCGINPKEVLGVKKFNEVPVAKYNSDTYDFAFEYTISKKRKLVLLVNSIPTYDEKQGWMNAYSISV